MILFDRATTFSRIGWGLNSLGRIPFLAKDGGLQVSYFQGRLCFSHANHNSRLLQHAWGKKMTRWDQYLSD